jgi:hypothetical protein
MEIYRRKSLASNGRRQWRLEPGLWPPAVASRHRQVRVKVASVAVRSA